MDSDPLPMTRTHRIASGATVVVPTSIAIGVFLFGWLGRASSGAGLSPDDRPVMVVLLSVLGAFGWFLGTSAMYALHRPARELPRTANAYGLGLISGSGAPAGDDSQPGHTTASAGQLLGMAVFTLPVLMFTAPMLLGFLAQPGVWRPDEAAAVAVMGVFVLAWSLLLIARAFRAR